MALSQKLEFRQTQALVMTPQLMQAIKLLQLSNLDLAAYVEGELERNPLLERANEAVIAAAAHTPGEEQSQERPEPTVFGSSDRQRSLDSSFENVFPDEPTPPGAARAAGDPTAYSEWATVGSRAQGAGDFNLEAFVAAETTLVEHLASQLSLADCSPARRMIGQHLIDLVDEAGYLTGDLSAVAERLGAPLEEVESVLALLQTFDPVGVCARNLTECLAIQLRERDRLDPVMEIFLDNLEFLAKRDLASLKKICGVDEEDLA